MYNQRHINILSAILIYLSTTISVSPVFASMGVLMNNVYYYSYATVNSDEITEYPALSGRVEPFSDSAEPVWIIQGKHSCFINSSLVS